MIAIDTSSFSAYFSGEKGRDINIISEALSDRAVVMLPIVLCELLSSSHMKKELEGLLVKLPLADMLEGVWVRTGLMRRKLLARARKARLADSLIAQICIDNHLGLVTRDRDFKAYQEFGLKLL